MLPGGPGLIRIGKVGDLAEKPNQVQGMSMGLGIFLGGGTSSTQPNMKMWGWSRISRVRPGIPGTFHSHVLHGLMILKTITLQVHDKMTSHATKISITCSHERVSAIRNNNCKNDQLSANNVKQLKVKQQEEPFRPSNWPNLLYHTRKPTSSNSMRFNYVQLSPDDSGLDHDIPAIPVKSSVLFEKLRHMDVSKHRGGGKTPQNGWWK